MPCRPLARPDITIVVTAFPEDIPVKGNFMCSGDKALDQQLEAEIFKRLKEDDLWAWATVCVTGSWEGLNIHQYLGCCSYESEEDFRNNSGHFDEMVDDVVAGLNTLANAIYTKLNA